MNLAELQRFFADAATSGHGPPSDLDRVFRGSEQLPAHERLAIYNRSYFYRLLDALASVFSQTKRLLGETAFDRLGLSYIEQTPSQHPAVERIGRAFPDYLRQSALPSLVVDCASLEWARLCALVAPNPASIASVRSVEPSRFPWARLRFVPSLQCLELDPRALNAFDDDEPVLSTSAAVEPRCGVAVWRADHAVRHERLESVEWQALRCAMSGNALNRICAVFDTGSANDDARRAFRALSRWFAQKWLESVLDDAEQATPP